MNSQQLTNTIKATLKKHNVKGSISTYYNTKTVTFKSYPTEDLINEIKSLQTVEHFGDSQNDTAWTTGISIQFAYLFPLRSEDFLMIRDWLNSLGEGFDKRSIHYHLREKFGFKGLVFIECGYLEEKKI